MNTAGSTHTEHFLRRCLHQWIRGTGLLNGIKSQNYTAPSRAAGMTRRGPAELRKAAPHELHRGFVLPDILLTSARLWAFFSEQKNQQSHYEEGCKHANNNTEYVHGGGKKARPAACTEMCTGQGNTPCSRRALHI